MPITPVPWTVLSSPGFPNPLQLNNATQDRPWILACPSWRNITHLQITAEGTWRENGGDQEFGPDGTPELSLPKEQLAVEGCPAGALIGKLGGSSAALGPVSGIKPATEELLPEGRAFAIGSFCVITLPTNCLGPLYIGFNGLKHPITVITLLVTIRGAPSG